MNEGSPVIIKYESGWVEVGTLLPCSSITKDAAGNDVYEQTVEIDPVASRAYRAKLEAPDAED